MAVSSIRDHELRAHPLLAGLSEGNLSRVKRGIHLTHFNEGANIFLQEEPSDRFFIVRTGQVKLYRLSPSGNEKVIKIVHPGQSFAEAVMFMEAPLFPVSAQALTTSSIYAIDSAIFKQVLAESVDTCFRVMADMSVRLHQLLDEIDALTLKNATLRLVNYILTQAPKDSANTTRISLPAPKNIVASRLSIQPETLSRILGNLSRNGLISVNGLDIDIHDLKGLRAYGD